VRAFATNSSDRRRASCTRCSHCSLARAESGKSPDCCCAKQYDDDANDDANNEQLTSRATVRSIMTRLHEFRRSNKPSSAYDRLLFLARMIRNRILGPAKRLVTSGVSAKRLKTLFAGRARAVRFAFGATSELARSWSNRSGRLRPKIHCEQVAEIQKEFFVEAAQVRGERGATLRQFDGLISMLRSGKSRRTSRAD
jgi:hypothetical protein